MLSKKPYRKRRRARAKKDAAPLPDRRGMEKMYVAEAGHLWLQQEGALDWLRQEVS